MHKLIKNYPYTIIAAIMAFIGYISLEIWGIDFFEDFIKLLDNLENHEFDEFIISIITITIGISLDTGRALVRKRASEKIMLNEIETLRATMTTVQDILGNFLNNLLVYQIKIEESGALDKKAIDDMNIVIYSTSERINKLANTKKIVLKNIGSEMVAVDIEEESG